MRDDFDIERFRALPSRVFAPRREGLVRPGDRIVQIAGTVRQSGPTNSMCIREL